MLRKNKILIELYLGESGVRVIAESIEKYNRTLEILSLTPNPFITNQCVDYLHQMIKRNITLKQLWLDNCNLSNKDKRNLQMMQRTNFPINTR
jgi:Ran GTPase-activating protein (RanGAP) involved in mRNA processing and transport